MTDQLPHVFVSYASADRERVLPVAAALERRGVHVWMDLASIPGGAIYGPEIASAIKTSAAVVLLCSAAAFASRNVRQEVTLAWKHERPILPVMLEQAAIPEDLEYWLEGAQWVELLDHPEQEWLPEVLRALSRMGVQASPTATTSEVSTAVPKVSLPIPLTALLGRDDEVRGIVELLTSHRLVTLTGPGGVGKTRLAIEAARTAAPSFPDGVVFASLGPVADPELVLPVVAKELGMHEQGGQPLIERIRAFLGEKRVLLVLDNFEHLLAAAPVLANLLAHAPQVRALATSRAPLHLSGEREVAVEPLASPVGGGQITAAQASAFSAVALFVARAEAVNPGFGLSDENAPDVAAICARLDGLPLAVELAAARSKLLPPSALLGRLERRLPLLTGGARDLPARQQTLRDTIAWSYDLLAPGERALFRQLAVFVGGWTLEAALSVSGEDGETSVLDGLAALVDISLVRREGIGDFSRFRMLETIREFALDQLALAGEAASLRDAHATYFLALSERAAVEIQGVLMRQWCDTLEADHPNLRAAFAEFVATGRATDELRLASALSAFWYFRGHHREGTERLEAALHRGTQAEPILRADALTGLSYISSSMGNRERTLTAAEEGYTLAKRAGDDLAMAAALYAWSIAEGWFGVRRNEGIALAERAVSLLEASGRTAIFRGHLLGDLGAMVVLAGDRDRGLALIEDAVKLHRAEGQSWGAGLNLAELGLAAHQAADAQSAAIHYGESLRLLREVQDPVNVYHSLTGLAGLAADYGRPELATRLLGAVTGIEERSGAVIHPSFRPSRERARERALADLGETGFASAFEVGRALPLDGAIDEAVAFAGELAMDMGDSDR